MSRVESGEPVQCEGELACYLQECESLIRLLDHELSVLRDEKYYQVDQLAFRCVGVAQSPPPCAALAVRFPTDLERHVSLLR